MVVVVVRRRLQNSWRGIRRVETVGKGLSGGGCPGAGVMEPAGTW